MKIGFAARYNPLDKNTWSGTSYYTYQQLKRFGEVEVFQFRLPKLLQEWLTTQKSINRRWFGKHTSVEFLKSYAKYFSKQLTRELKKRPVDVLFVSASSQLIAYVETEIPIVYMTDATFQQLQGYYASFSNLAEYNVRQGISLDRQAFQKASHCMLASDWCRQAAISDYGVDTSKISVVPCGANLDSIPSAPSVRNNGDICRLLFLGVEWQRKGGDIALGTYFKLKEQGIPVQLHIIGCVPPQDISAETEIINIPFLDKNKEVDFKKLDEIFKQTDFLLLPTRAECAGIVFCEASAYGIPSISTNTGGVTTYVQDEKNGFALAPVADPDEYAVLVSQLFTDKMRMNNLRQSSRLLFEQELNWDAWGNQFKAIAENLLNRKSI